MKASKPMISTRNLNPRTITLLEIAAFLVLLHVVRAGFDQISWRFAGPMTLAAVLTMLLIFMRRRSVGLKSIGIAKISWPKGGLLLLPQILFAIILIVASGIGTTLLGEALDISIFTDEQPDAELRWGNLQGNTSLYLLWLAILCFAGPAEELFFRGYLVSRLNDALGNSFLALTISVVFPALIFGLGHVYYQGWRGFFVTGMIGLTLGILFLLYRRNLWPLMIAHAAVNSIMFTALYLGADF